MRRTGPLTATTAPPTYNAFAHRSATRAARSQTAPPRSPSRPAQRQPTRSKTTLSRTGDGQDTSNRSRTGLGERPPPPEQAATPSVHRHGAETPSIRHGVRQRTDLQVTRPTSGTSRETLHQSSRLTSNPVVSASLTVNLVARGERTGGVVWPHLLGRMGPCRTSRCRAGSRWASAASVSTGPTATWNARRSVPLQPSASSPTTPSATSLSCAGRSRCPSATSARWAPAAHTRSGRASCGSGVEAQQLAALRSPIGLDLGARTPEETVMSITAEIIAHANGTSGLPLSLHTRPVHRAAAGILPTASTLIE